MRRISARQLDLSAEAAEGLAGNIPQRPYPDDPARRDRAGPSIRITRNKGEAVRLVQEGDANAAVVAVKRVNETDFYSLGARDLAKKLGRNETRLLWFIRREKVQENPDFFKVITIGKSPFKRYSRLCYEMLRKRLAEVDLDALWEGRNATAVPESAQNHSGTTYSGFTPPRYRRGFLLGY